MALPLFAGGVNVTVTVALPRSTVGRAGAFGTAAGTVTGGESGDCWLVPTAFVALTTHMYVVPRTSPATMIGELGPDIVTGEVPLPQVAVKLVMALAPLLAGGANVTVICVPV